MSHRFDVYEDRAGQYRWRLVASNGRIVADSGEGYTNAANAREAAQRIRDRAPDAALPHFDVDHFEVYEDRAGQYRWRLVASNGQIIADSGEGYGTKTHAHDAAEAITGHVGDATIEDEH
jgi:uncharacterized protein YegP (UPF0339 family)